MKDKNIETKAAFKRRMENMKKPKGFTARFENQVAGESFQLVFILEKEGDCKLEFRHEFGDGTTTFHTNHGVKTFDRLGVDSSFYHRPFTYERGGAIKPKPVGLNELVKEQLARVAERREFINTSILIPDVKFRISADQVEEYKKRLKMNGVIQFTPSGFGTGYEVKTKPTRGLRYGERRAVPELEEFFGVSPLYVATLDCD